MKDFHKAEQTDAGEENVIPFRIPPKPDAADPIGYNWLRDLPVGSAFAVRPRNTRGDVTIMHVNFHGNKVTNLVVENGDNTKFLKTVVTSEFSNTNERIETLYDPRWQNEPTRNERPQGDGTVSTGSVECDAGNQGNPAS